MIPVLGLGTYGRTGEDGIRAMQTAIEIGYRHLDTAQTYGTEAGVGEAMRRSGLPRSDFFVTTKVSENALDRALFMPSVEASLKTIGVDQIDLLLIHWPSPQDAVPFDHYIEALAEAQRRGHARLIGVSNFPIALLQRTEALLGKGAIATNQVEIHPYLQSRRLCAHARATGLKLTAYQPIASGRASRDPVLIDIAARHGVTASAVSLAFVMAEGHVVIPASSSEAHLRANFVATGVRLSADEMAQIRKLEEGYRIINPPKAPIWDD
jgi:2,5-diketo-D-gluconate reductase B